MVKSNSVQERQNIPFTLDSYFSGLSPEVLSVKVFAYRYILPLILNKLEYNIKYSFCPCPFHFVYFTKNIFEGSFYVSTFRSDFSSWLKVLCRMDVR